LFVPRLFVWSRCAGLRPEKHAYVLGELGTRGAKKRPRLRPPYPLANNLKKSSKCKKPNQAVEVIAPGA
jgi:hypothetical protein